MQCELSEQPATGRHLAHHRRQRGDTQGEPRMGVNEVGPLTKEDPGRVVQKGPMYGESWKDSCRLVEAGPHAGLICLEFILDFRTRGSEAQCSGFKSWFCHLLAVCS